MDDGALDNAVESHRRLGLDRLFARHRRKGAVQHLFQIASELGKVHTAGGEKLPRLRIFN
jgi:hypothetical protein